MKTFLHTLLVSLSSLSLLMLGACSSARLPPIPAGVPVSFVVNATPPGDAATVRMSIRGDVKAGVGAGAVMGGLWGLSCGPAAFFCVPFGALVGAGPGALMGTAVGVGRAGEARYADLNEKFAARLRNNNMPNSLQQKLEERAKGRWPIAAGGSEHQVLIEQRDVFLQAHANNQLALVVRLMVSVKPVNENYKGSHLPRKIDYVGPVSDIAIWMDEKNDFFSLSMQLAEAHLAARILSELSAI